MGTYSPTLPIKGLMRPLISSPIIPFFHSDFNHDCDLIPWTVASGTWYISAEGLGNPRKCLRESTGIAATMVIQLDHPYRLPVRADFDFLVETDTNFGGGLDFLLDGGNIIRVQVFPAAGAGQISLYRIEAGLLTEFPSAQVIDALTWYRLALVVDGGGTARVFFQGSEILSCITVLTSFVHTNFFVSTTACRFDNLTVTRPG